MTTRGPMRRYAGQKPFHKLPCEIERSQNTRQKGGRAVIAMACEGFGVPGDARTQASSVVVVACGLTNSVQVRERTRDEPKQEPVFVCVCMCVCVCV